MAPVVIQQAAFSASDEARPLAQPPRSRRALQAPRLCIRRPRRKAPGALDILYQAPGPGARRDRRGRSQRIR